MSEKSEYETVGSQEATMRLSKSWKYCSAASVMIFSGSVEVDLAGRGEAKRGWPKWVPNRLTPNGKVAGVAKPPQI